MKRRSSLVLLAATVVLFGPVFAGAAAGMPAGYGAVLSSLKSQATIPVLLPVHPERFNANRKVVASIIDQSGGGYTVLLDPPRCRRAHACHFATVTGYPKAASWAPDGDQPVTLADGTHAFFTHSTCGASCSDSTLTWDTDAGNRYSIGIKAGLRVEVLGLANAMRPF